MNAIALLHAVSVSPSASPVPRASVPGVTLGQHGFSTDALVGVIGTLLGVIVGAALGYLLDRRLEKSRSLHDWDDRTLTVLGRVNLLLTDAEPRAAIQGIGPGIRDHAQRRLMELSAQWDPVRTSLAEASVGHPDEGIRDRLWQLILSIQEGLNQDLELLQTLAAGGVPGPNDLRTARDTLQGSARKCGELLVAVRQKMRT